MNAFRNEPGVPREGELLPDSEPSLDPRTAQLLAMLEKNAELYRRMGHNAVMFPADQPGSWLTITRKQQPPIAP